MKILQLIATCMLLEVVRSSNVGEETTEFWNRVTERELNQAKNVFEHLKFGRAKNVILLVGDGMSLSTVTAGRIAIGQKWGGDGEDHVTSLDRMPHAGFVKTYSVNSQTPDSAATATAFLSGVKTRTGFLGVNARGSSCSTVNDNKVTSSLEYAIGAGKSTGVITTTRVQHATPASGYAHAHRRSLFSDGSYRSDEINIKDRCPDIAMQLFNKREDIQVILGGGRTHMMPHNMQDIENPRKFGDRRDGRNLIEEWTNDMNRNHSASYVWRKSDFDAVDPVSTDYLLGLFSPLEMQYSLNRENDVGGEPSLAEMTEKAIRILRKNDNGFFLLIESGLIDKAHHLGRAIFALEEFYELEKALDIAQFLTDPDETLIVTTADHGHMMMLGGNGVRGNNVYGLAPSNNHPLAAKDGKYYTTLLYANGPGHVSPRRQVSRFQTVSKWYRQQSAVPLYAETHSAEDTVVLSSGPMAHLLTGVHEQTHIASVIQYAACLGPYAEEPHCVSLPPFSALLVGERSRGESRAFDDFEHEEMFDV